MVYDFLAMMSLHDIERRKAETLRAIAAARNPAELEQIRIATLGRKGWLKLALRNIGAAA